MTFEPDPHRWRTCAWAALQVVGVCLLAFVLFTGQARSAIDPRGRVALEVASTCIPIVRGGKVVGRLCEATMVTRPVRLPTPRAGPG